LIWSARTHYSQDFRAVCDWKLFLQTDQGDRDQRRVKKQT
jgi:hypothetical protein